MSTQIATAIDAAHVAQAHADGFLVVSQVRGWLQEREAQHGKTAAVFR